MAQSYERYKSFFKVTCGHYGSQIQNANACKLKYFVFKIENKNYGHKKSLHLWLQNTLKIDL